MSTRSYVQFFIRAREELEFPSGPVRSGSEVSIRELIRNPDPYDLRLCATALADRDLLLIGGWDDSNVTIEHHILPLYRARGLHLECHRSGELLMQTDFTPSESPAVKWPATRSYYLVKHIPPASRSGSPLIQVVRLDLDKKTLHSSSTGSAHVEFFDGQRDPLRQLGPVEVLGARLDTMDSVVDYGEVVETISG